MDGQYLYLATLGALGPGIAVFARYNYRRSLARYKEAKKKIEVDAPVSRPRGLPLTPQMEALYDAIEEKAAELETLYEQLPDGRYKALVLTDLESSVMWIIKELTA